MSMDFRPTLPETWSPYWTLLLPIVTSNCIIFTQLRRKSEMGLGPQQYWPDSKTHFNVERHPKSCLDQCKDSKIQYIGLPYNQGRSDGEYIGI